MFIQVKNENYGYAVATYGDYVVSGNPAITRYNSSTASVFYTGSVDLFRYNRNTDEHDYVTTLYKYVNLDVLLGRESDRKALQTEDTGSVPRTSDKGLLIDKNLYTFIAEDGFGLSLDMYKKLLVVGSPYYSQSVDTYAYHASVSGSAVDIFDLANTEFVSLTSSIYVYSIEDPDLSLPAAVTGSFGYSVSINENWIAVGSPYVSSSKGMVYIYKNVSTGSNFSWSLYQKIEASGSIVGAEFGSDLKLNKYTGSHSASMVVGCGNPLNGQAYYFELTNSVWTQTFVFLPDYTIQPMTFSDYLPYTPTMNVTNGFGKAVSIYGDSVIIGEYLDRSFYEYSGSSLYQQGSVYIFERCNNQSYTLFQQVFKSYGNTSSLKNNDAGFSVDIFENNAVAGVPKTDVLTLDSCYVAGTLEQLHYCSSDLEHLLIGQTMFVQKNTSSNDWEITNIYQKKKKFLSPYRSYGFDVAIADKSMVVGSPMYLYDSNRQMNITITQSNDVELDDVMGKSYIYNLKNLRDQFHVGNVFYRNGKIIIMTSGSIFDGLFFNPVNTSTYEYDLQFKGQHTIFEKQIICSVSPGEFNVSTNPTAIITNTSSLDTNKNGKMDFQDLDVVLRYMQYKNTSLLGSIVSTDWTSSIVTSNDEISLLNYYQENTDNTNTSFLTSESIVRWETTDTWMQDVLDLNDDNKIDVRDMNIMWKHFTNRLTQENYATYITPACNRKLFSDIIDYMDVLTQRNAKPLINPLFLDYEYNVANDKTGSFLAPYVTTIGLYKELDLVAVAKLGTPIKNTPELPMNFVIRLDF